MSQLRSTGTTGPTPATKPATPAAKVELSTVAAALENLAGSGVRPGDLPAPSDVRWAEPLKGRWALARDDAKLIADSGPRDAELLAAIDADSTDAVLQRWRAEQTEARSDDVTRAVLESKRTAIETARLRRKAAKAALGELRGALARQLVPAGRRLLQACQTIVEELAAREATTAARFGLQPHVSPLVWSLNRSLEPLRQALARGYCPPAVLTRYAGPLDATK